MSCAKPGPYHKGQGHTWRLKVNSTTDFVGAYLLHAWMDFNETSHKCSPLWDGVSRTRTRSLAQRSRSHLEVKGQIEPHTLSGAYLLHAWRDFNQTSHKCSPLLDGVSCAKNLLHILVFWKCISQITKQSGIQYRFHFVKHNILLHLHNIFDIPQYYMIQ